jgi:hypothetical protein
MDMGTCTCGRTNTLAEFHERYIESITYNIRTDTLAEFHERYIESITYNIVSFGSDGVKTSHGYFASLEATHEFLVAYQNSTLKPRLVLLRLNLHGEYEPYDNALFNTLKKLATPAQQVGPNLRAHGFDNVRSTRTGAIVFIGGLYELAVDLCVDDSYKTSLMKGVKASFEFDCRAKQAHATLSDVTNEIVRVRRAYADEVTRVQRAYADEATQ